MSEPAPEPRLTSLAHGGGCGCKIAPAVLSRMLASVPMGRPFEQLLVGTETSDDAAVWKLSEDQALVATTDFFMPVVDDPFDFGRIAATNALSDVYAMGGKPILALALVGMPINILSPETIGRILEGGDLGEQIAQQQPRGQSNVRIVVDDDAAAELPGLSHACSPTRACVR